MSTTQVGIKLTLDGAQQTEAGLRRVAGGVESVGQSAGKASSGLADLKGVAGGIAGGLGAAFAVDRLAAFANELVNVQRRFDVLNASLVTVSGSQAAAEREFEWIGKFAATTPYQLNEVTQAFVKLKTMGLDASKESLTSYGNIAAAMGKSLDQMVEAVSDASTGEFERLKEFGIRASKQGDDIALTFKGVTTVVGDSAEEITRYLRQIGDVDFAGAMDERAKTLDGAISNLTDSWEGLLRTISRSGFGNAVANDVRTMSAELGLLTEVMENARKRGDSLAGVLADGLGAALGRLAFSGVEGTFNTFNGILNAVTGNVLNLNTNLDLMPTNLKSNADQVVILGAKLKDAEAEFAKLQERAKATPDNIYLKSEMAQLAQYIVKVREAREEKLTLEGRGAYAAEDARLLRQNNAPAEQAKQEAAAAAARAKARAEFDTKYASNGEKLSAELAKQRKLLGDTFTAEDERRIVASFNRVGSAGSKAAKDVGDAFAAQRDAAKEWADSWKRAEDLLRGVTNEQLGLNKAQEQILAYLTSPAYEQNTEAMRELVLQKLYAADAQIKLNAALAEEQRWMDQSNQANQQAADKAYEAADALEEQVRQQQLANEEIGLTGYALADLKAARQEDAAAEKERLAAIMDGIDPGIADEYRRQAKALRELAAGGRAGAAKDVAVESAREAEREWKRTTDEIERSLTDALMRGFESGKGFGENLRDTLVNMFKTLVLRPVIQATVQGGLNAIGLGAPAGAGGALNTVSNLNSLFNTGSKLASWLGLGSAAAGTGLAATAGTGMALASTAGTGLGLSAMGGTGLSLASTSTGLGLTASTSALGVSAGAPSFLSAIPGWGWAAMAGLALLSGLDDSGTYHTGGAGSYSDAQGLRSGQSVDGLDFRPSEYKEAIATGSAAFAKGLVGVLDSTAKNFGKEAGYWAATGFADDTSKDGAWGALSIMRDGKSVLDWGNGADKWPGREFKDGEKGYTEYLKAVAGDVRDLLIESTPEWADAMLEGLGDSVTMEQLAAKVGEINRVQAALVGLGDVMPQLASLSDEASTALLGMFDDIDSLAAAAGSYYENFYTDAERTAITTRQVTDALGELGLSMPATRAQYRALVEAQDLTTESGRATYAALLSLAPAFASVTDAAKDATAAAEEQAKAAMAAADSAYQVLSRAVDAERQALQRQLSLVSDSVSDLTGLFSTIRGGLDSLYGGVESVAAMRAQEARGFIAQAASTARTTGYLPEADALQQAIDAVGADPTVYASRVDAERARLQTAAQLAALGELTGDQLDTATQQLRALERQIDQNEMLLEAAQAQLNALKGIDTTVLSVSDALRLFYERTFELGEFAPEAAADAGTTKAGSGGFTLGGGTAAPVYATDGERLAAEMAAYEAAGKAYRLTNLPGAGLVVSAAAGEQQDLTDQQREWLRKAGVPGFDVGTDYVPRDMLALIHQGEQIVPKAYNPHANGQLAGMKADNSRLEAHVASLVAEVQALREQVREGNRHALRTANATNGNPENPMPVEAVN